MLKICLIVPSLKAGGMERVMSEVANYLAKDKSIETHLILLSCKENFFPISSEVNVHRPDSISSHKIFTMFYLAKFIRNKMKEIGPNSVLSFGSMYNSFVLLSSLGLGIKVYVSDRSNPYRNTKLTFKKDPIERHDGIIHFFLKKILYKRAAGIFVQTRKAKEIEYNFSKHKNINLFFNPVRDVKKFPSQKKEKWIINVGRFIKTKNQLILIKQFSKIRFGDWKLVFAGDGPELSKAKMLASELGLNGSVLFLGNVRNVDWYLRKSEIFAFPSVSEGFPNALAEGMKASLACIAYDCVAGPSDLIQDSINGFLIPLGEEKLFQKKLHELMTNKERRQKFQSRAGLSLKKFDKSLIIENLKKELIKK